MHCHNRLSDIYYRFDSLEFLPHPNPYISGTRAMKFFPNGYGVSVVCSNDVFSNGRDNYELVVVRGNSNTWMPMMKTAFSDGPIGYLSKARVSEYMIKVQKLPMIITN